MAKKISITRKIGRRPKIGEVTPSVYTRMLKQICVGVSDEKAAMLIGIYPGTFYRWMARGRDALEIEAALDDDDKSLNDKEREKLQERLKKLDAESLYRQFCEDVSQARAICLGNAEIKIRQNNPLAFLRRHDKRWLENSSDIQHTIDGSNAGQIENQVSGEYAAGLTLTPDVPTVLSTLQALSELGFIEFTEAGKALFQQNHLNCLAPE